MVDITDEEIFFDWDGKPCSLDKLCRLSPEWAASRIRAERNSAAAVAAALSYVREDLRDSGEWEPFEEMIDHVLKRHYDLMRREK